MQQIPQQGFTYSSFKVFIALLFILGIIFLLSYIMKKINIKNGGFLNSGIIKVISRYPLGERRYLYVVKVGEEILLLGITPQSVNYIKELDLKEETLDVKTKEKNGKFIEILKEKVKEVRRR